MMGAGLLLPQGVLARAGEILEGPAPKVKFFNKAQRKLVAALAECVIPRTDTPGAQDAGVPQWIEVLVKDCFELDGQRAFLAGLTKIDTDALTQYNLPFLKLTPAQQIEFLTDLERRALAVQRSNPQGPPAFILGFKDLTKFAYVHSERGATETFEYILVPGRWDGSAPVTATTKVPVTP